MIGHLEGITLVDGAYRRPRLPEGWLAKAILGMTAVTVIPGVMFLVFLVRP